MKILATLDGTPFAESILPVLEKMAALPNADITLLAVAHEPESGVRRRGPRRPVLVTDMMGRASPMIVQQPGAEYVENRGQAIERRMAQLEDYLSGVAQRLPNGTHVHVEVDCADNPADMIIEHAREEGADVVVMATRSRSGLAHALTGSTTEHVIRSGVAPVLVVHPARD